MGEFQKQVVQRGGHKNYVLSMEDIKQSAQPYTRKGVQDIFVLMGDHEIFYPSKGRSNIFAISKHFNLIHWPSLLTTAYSKFITIKKGLQNIFSLMGEHDTY